MTDVANPPASVAVTAVRAPQTTPPQRNRILPQGMKLDALPQSVETLRSRLQHTAVFSPVNQNGSFDFDRVIKSGELLKRTRKTKNWRPIHIVLRPNVVSLYKDKDQTKLRHQINLSELTAVARQKDPKGKVQHGFALFSPSRNFHLATSSEKDAQEWVELIRNEARIDEEEEEELVLMSPGATEQEGFPGVEQLLEGKRETVASSSSEAEFGQRPTSAVTPGSMHSARRPSHTLTHSGNDYGSFSDFSDSAPPGGFRSSNVSLSTTNNNFESIRPHGDVDKVYSLDRPDPARNASQVSGLGVETDAERVVCHGWLHILKSKRGMRQWKKYWVVLRPKTLALYKNEEEYSASLIISFPSIINAVEIDPISKSRRHCMQVITEERNYRFCAADEDSLAIWLGTVKSLLAKRKEAERDQDREKEKEKEKATGQAPAQDPTPTPP